ncbi:hypothetical protein [Wenzhouxiangella sp. XN24]|uniref:hypothetical protein n=1 Tax=Wenzhouxiangella sp. XN24 TaxID=2713569 RepID=UPI0013ED31E6|nr:hypothetical protein [Wenzhouxiangella sp. XN24]NGX17100.1 hypothetical protein [Wenzhouxiangella sp. XN24]
MKAQNWFAVGLDFVIVVVGVFVGLQVQDWNDSRKERVEEGVLMVRLFEETRSLIDAHERELASLRSRAKVLIGFVAERRDHLLELKDTLVDLIERQGQAPGTK